MADTMLSAGASGVEDRKTDQKTWARLALQTHCPSQTVRRTRRWWREVCPHHPLRDAQWSPPHGCATRVRALAMFLTVSTPAEIQAAVVAGLITEAEAEHGVHLHEPQAGRGRSKPRRGGGRRPARGPTGPVPDPLDSAGIG